MFFDSHAHLLDSRFDEDRDRIISMLPSQGVGWFTEVAADMDTSIHAAALAAEHHMAYATVGIHPHDARTWESHFEGQLRSLSKEKKVVAVGEIGLDYHYDLSPRDVQRSVFEHQMQLARDLDMPVVIHSREAMADTLDVLKAFPDVSGILHSFSGSVETMEILVGMGYYISFNGTVTFKNAKKPVAVARHVPMERMLIETDCPYMTPVPHRGKRNDPSYVKYTAEKIAELRGVEVEEIESVTAVNAANVYRIELE